MFRAGGACRTDAGGRDADDKPDRRTLRVDAMLCGTLTTNIASADVSEIRSTVGRTAAGPRNEVASERGACRGDAAFARVGYTRLASRSSIEALRIVCRGADTGTSISSPVRASVSADRIFCGSIG